MDTENKEIASYIKSQQANLAKAMVALQYHKQPEIWEAYGDSGHAKSVRDATYHLTYLREAINAGDPTLFVDYISWAKILLDNLGFEPHNFKDTMICMQETLERSLPAEMHTIIQEYLNAGFQHLTTAPGTTKSFINGKKKFAVLAKSYLEALLDANRHAASKLILEAVEQGASIKEIYLNVFQPVQHEIGRLWQLNQISVAQEHYCTAVTQQVMSLLYPYIFSTPKTGYKLVATCIGGELHEIGVRMIADFFEMDGWNTYYLGANTPTESLIQTLEDRKPEILGISATMTSHISAVADLIKRVRLSIPEKNLKILVGGHPFNIARDLYKKVNANGYAPNAQEAILLADKLLKG